MKVSIVLPVYNEPEFVKKAVESVYKQTFKKENMELIIIDDGSTDNTLSEVKGMLKGRKEIKVKVISTKNQGRSIAREKGVISASFNNILFLDARCILSDDFVEKLSKLKYQPIVPNPVINQETIYGRFGHLIRKRIYKGSYGNFKPYYITRSNYEKSGKGTGGLFIDKKLFLKSQIENKTSKDNSDDIKLLRNVVNRKKILKHPDLIIKYSPRSDIINHVSHTFLRGAKFVDYYSRPGTRFNLELILFVIISLILGVLLFLNPIFIILLVVMFTCCITFVSAFLSDSIRDVIIVMYLLPLTSIAFVLGIYRGIILKIVKRY